MHLSLCCTKPSAFVSSESAKLFSNKYVLIHLGDLHGEDGSPTSSRWFSSNGWREKVYVATTFSLLLGNLRLKLLDSRPFLNRKYFQLVVSYIDATAFNYACECDCSGAESPELVELKAHVDALEAQLTAAAKDIVEIRNSKGSCKFTRYSAIYTKPAKKSYPTKMWPKSVNSRAWAKKADNCRLKDR